MNNLVINFCLTAVFGYLIGSISFGYLLARVLKGKDIRTVGSGNAGTANAIRNYGWGIGLLTFLGDVLKGVAAAIFGLCICGDMLGEEYITICALVGGLASIIGHVWPVYFGFRGGKGVAASLGVFLVVMPIQTAIIFCVCIVVIALTKTTSIGSLTGATLMGFSSLIIFRDSIGCSLISILIIALVLYSHRENIQRLIQGNENSIKQS